MVEINKNTSTPTNVAQPVNKWLIIWLVIALVGSVLLWHRLYYIAVGVALYGFLFILILPGTALTIINLIIIPIVDPLKYCGKFVERSDSHENSSISSISNISNSDNNTNVNANSNANATHAIDDDKELINNQSVDAVQMANVKRQYQYQYQGRHININKTLTVLLGIIIIKIAICGIVLLICFQTGQSLQVLRIGLPHSSTTTPTIPLVKSVKVPIMMPENCRDPRLTFSGLGQQQQQAIDKIIGLHSTGVFDTYEVLTLQLNQNFTEADFIKLSCSLNCGNWPINCLITNQEINPSYNWVLILFLIILLIVLQALYFSNISCDPLGLLSANKIVPLQQRQQQQQHIDETKANDAKIAINADADNNLNPKFNLSDLNSNVKDGVQVINEARIDINPNNRNPNLDELPSLTNGTSLINSVNLTTFKQLNQPVTHLHIDTGHSTPRQDYIPTILL